MINSIPHHGDNINILGISEDSHHIIFIIEPQTETAICPACHHESHRQHSKYVRIVQDLPINDREVTLFIHSHKWFCDQNDCDIKIFTERIPWLKPHRRKTQRLEDLLLTLAFSMSCLQAEKVCGLLHIPISHDALLDLIYKTPIQPKEEKSPFVAIDDFAFRKGTSYGTLICDLTTGHPIAMLPSRKKEDVTAWLNEHPNVKLVSRDGSHTYKKAISDADYLIVQVMDRFHLVKKLHEHMTDAFKRIFPYCWLIPIEKSQPLPLPSTPELEHSKQTEHQELNLQQQKKWKLIQTLQREHRAGVSIRSLAKTYKISRQSVRKYLDLTSPPIYQQNRKRVTLLDDFIDIIAAQIEKQATSHSIFKQIQEKGYEGSFSTVHRYATALRKQLKKEKNEQKQSKTTKKKAAKSLFLFFGVYTKN